MKRLRFVAACLSIFLLWGGVHAATYSGCIEGSGNVESETRSVEPFQSLDVSGAYDVKVACGETLRMEISADDNLLQHIRTNVEDGVLFIESAKAFCTMNRLTVNLSIPDIETISMSGAVDLSIDGVDNKRLGVYLKGSGSVRASGSTAAFVAEASGASRFDASALECKSARVNISGASEAVVHVTETLDVDISGAGELIYYGDPKTVTKKISGAGEMIKK